MFKCTKCGICCKQVSKFEITKSLDNGKGICKYLDTDTNLCIIYEHRPDICNVEKVYDLYFSKIMTKEEYYKLNYESCKILQKEGVV